MTDACRMIMIQDTTISFLLMRLSACQVDTATLIEALSGGKGCQWTLTRFTQKFALGCVFNLDLLMGHTAFDRSIWHTR